MGQKVGCGSALCWTFAALLANLIEKYAVVLDLDALPDLVIEEAVPEKDEADKMIHENDIESAKAA